jgi:hypothetical protein
LYTNALAQGQNIEHEISLPTASTTSPESQRSPPEVPQAPLPYPSYDTKVNNGRSKVASAAFEDFSMFDGDPFGLDDILQFPSQF